MDRRFLTVLGVSLLFALVVSSIFYQLTSRKGGGTPKVDTETKDVVIAAKPLQIGTTVKPNDLKVMRVAVASYPKGAFERVEDVIDRPVISNILLEEPVLEGRLAVRGSGVGIAPAIPVGMRAVSVRVNEVVGVAGFALPGMRVDVLVTGRPPESEGSLTTTVLQNILVLSAGQTTQADANGQAINAPTVTLLVTPEQAETLTLAGSEGKIQLVLRNSTDHGIESTPGRDVRELYQRGAAPPSKIVEQPRAARPRPPSPRVDVAVVPPPPPPAPPKVDEIVMIRGTKRTVEVVGHSATEGAEK
jgi:pilus assembly protein CpaB